MKRSTIAQARAFNCAVILALLSIAGCQTAQTLEEPLDEVATSDDGAPPADPKAAPETSASRKPKPDDSTPASHASLVERLGEDRWVRVIAPARADRTKPQLRWRHPQIEPVQWQTPQRSTQLLEGLASDNAAVSANAAIFAARAGSAVKGARLSDRLAQVVRNSKLKLPQRCAAAESLGLLRDPATGSTIQKLIDEFGNEHSPGTSTYIVDLHVDLLRALPWHASPSSEPRFAAALQSRSPEARVAALEGWAIHSRDEFPQAAVELRQDADPRVRGAVLTALAAQPHPQAYEYLSQALDDRDFSVRMTAIAALGRLGGEQARATLDRMKHDPSEVARSAVVTALATAGADQEAISAALDKSSRVRQAVAQVLATAPLSSEQIKQESIELAHRLLRDASAEVQVRAVESLASWPLEVAGPVLLKALEQSTFMTRQAAAKQLAERWRAATAFPVDGPADKRRESLTELQAKWVTEFGSLQDRAVAAVKDEVRQRVDVSPEQLAEVVRLLTTLTDPTASPQRKQQTLATLSLLGSDLIPILDTIAGDGKTPLPAELFSDVLPGISPVFKDLEKLASSDVTARRLAAAALLAQLSGRPLTPLELYRLAELMSQEIDPVVWQQAMRIVRDDSREAAQRLAQLAAGHVVADVRRQACEYFCLHADPRHATLLVDLLKDTNSSVVTAAVRAIAAGRALDDPRPLLELLVTPDKLLRAEVALALARLKVAEGAAAIERLALETELQVRSRIATGLGELGDPAFVPILIAMLDDRPDVQRAAVRSLQQVIGVEASVIEVDKPETLDQQVRRWQQWHRDRKAAEAGG